MSTKHIFVTGGVVSSLGKGITAAGLGQLLKSRGFKVLTQKFDPYLNVDPGVMSPYQHGEVFVTEDGAETDLDLGHYERFIDIDLNKYCSVSAGKIYWSVLNKERNGEYDGRTVQVIPHITNEIKDRMLIASQKSDVDVVITEIGGTVGDIESLPFLEAIRQIKYELGRENVMYIHMTLVPYLEKAGELKTKPTQHSVKELRGLGIQPDILICRTELPLNDGLKDKIALFCDLNPEEVIENMDVSTIYEIPIMLEEKGLPQQVMEHLGLKEKNLPDLSEWERIVKVVNNPKTELDIALVGKYVELKDAYLSIAESLRHGAIDNEAKVNIHWIHSEDITEENVKNVLQDMDGIIVPSGFGHRGIDGMITAIEHARENELPFLGIGLGMQLAVVEFARNVVGLKGADSVEMNPETNYPVINGLVRSEGRDKPEMRLGSYPARLKKGSKLYQAYNEEYINERHRHRYEFNNEYKDILEDKGLVISAVYEEENLVEAIELKDHPWFVGVNFNAEFKSRPIKAHPLFSNFIKKSIEYNG